MDDFRVAVKAFIVQDKKFLLLRRRSNDVHKPDTWDIPGGRLEIGEDPFEGLKREVLEETKLEVDVLLPVDIHHFIRDDGQKITMIVFLCKPQGGDVQISEEHQEYKWADLAKAHDNQIPDWLEPTLKNIKGFRLLENL